MVASISSVAEEFAASMSARWDGEIIHDPIQRVRVCFLLVPRIHGIRCTNWWSRRAKIRRSADFLKKRGGLHHVCYEINDLDHGLEAARRTGWAIVSSPAPAVAFDGRTYRVDCFQDALADGIARAVTRTSHINQMDISVVIVGWNAKHYLELCLESLAAAPPRRSMEVLVVDNASSDGSAEMIEARFP